MKNEEPADAEPEDRRENSHKAEQGADSQLHCYNEVSWRMAEMFGAEESPEQAGANKTTK